MDRQSHLWALLYFELSQTGTCPEARSSPVTRSSLGHPLPPHDTRLLPIGPGSPATWAIPCPPLKRGFFLLVHAAPIDLPWDAAWTNRKKPRSTGGQGMA